jgi:hypothetical protein
MEREHPHLDGSGNPLWIFRWRGLDGPLFPKLMAVLVTAIGFGFFLAFVRVEVVPPPGWIEDKAKLIHLPEGPEGRAWRMLALEEGPSPSRFEPAEWQGATAYQDALEEAMRPAATPYRPTLLPLPEGSLQRKIPILREEDPVFPPHPKEKPTAPTLAAGERLVATLHPLSGLSRDQLPAALPPVPDLGDELRGVNWEFILRIGNGGTVVDAISLAGPDAPGARDLTAWLRGLRFPENAPQGYVTLRLELSHPPADEPDPE